jgi:hypothetical protein
MAEENLGKRSATCKDCGLTAQNPIILSIMHMKSMHKKTPVGLNILLFFTL